MLEILDNLTQALNLATIEENWKYRVGRQTDLRIKFNEPTLTMRSDGHFLIINIDGQDQITIGSMATDEQIGAEIARIRNVTEKPTMAITDAGKLAANIKDRINSAKARIASVNTNIDNGLAKLNDAADTGDKIAKQIETEAEDLLAQIGQFHNGGPE